MAVLLMASCKKNSENFVPDCSGATKSFNADVLPIITNKCKGCHSQYSGYSQIAGSKSSIRSSIVEGSMPQGGSLSTTEKNNVICWIDNGALNN